MPPSQPPPLPPFLDYNIIEEILSLLPADSLMKFKYVCKSWKSIISDPRFVKLHLHRSYARTADLSHVRFMFRCYENASACSLSSLLEQKVLYQHPLSREYRFIGTCNGLIALLKDNDNVSDDERRAHNYQVCLWNPTTKLMSQESPPLFDVRREYYNFGFGYDYVSDTYKVIAINIHMVKVHTMGGNCWRSILFSTHYYCNWKDGVYLNGTLNWIANRITDYHIKSFDLGAEKCSQLSLPPYSYDYLKQGVPTLVILKDCLCVCYNYQVIIWQMKKFGVQESWTQLLNITNMHINMVPLCMSENDDVLLLSKSKGLLFLWNHRENITACFETPKNYYYQTHSVQSYIGSLVSPC